jgi:hypothetical protein
LRISVVSRRAGTRDAGRTAANAHQRGNSGKLCRSDSKFYGWQKTKINNRSRSLAQSLAIGSATVGLQLRRSLSTCGISTAADRNRARSQRFDRNLTPGPRTPVHIQSLDPDSDDCAAQSVFSRRGG